MTKKNDPMAVALRTAKGYADGGGTDWRSDMDAPKPHYDPISGEWIVPAERKPDILRGAQVYCAILGTIMVGVSIAIFLLTRERYYEKLVSRTQTHIRPDGGDIQPGQLQGFGERFEGPQGRHAAPLADQQRRHVDQQLIHQAGFEQ